MSIQILHKKGIQVLPSIFYIALFIIVLFCMGVLFSKFPGIEQKILNLLRSWFNLPIPDMAVRYTFDEESGSCIKDSSNHENLGRLGINNRVWDCEFNPGMLDTKNKMVGSASIRFRGSQFLVVQPSDLGKKMLNMENIEGMTIDFWLYVKGTHDNNYIYFIYNGKSKEDCNKIDGDAVYCLILTPEDKILFKVKLTDGTTTDYCSITSKNRLSPEFNHLAVIYNNKTNEVKIYIQGFFDNKLECQKGMIASSVSSEASLYVGCRDSSCPVDTEGGLFIDELRIYTREISPEEIFMHFQGID